MSASWQIELEWNNPTEKQVVDFVRLMGFPVCSVYWYQQRNTVSSDSELAINVEFHDLVDLYYLDQSTEAENMARQSGLIGVDLTGWGVPVYFTISEEPSDLEDEESINDGFFDG